jgi:hypothetical protein
MIGSHEISFWPYSRNGFVLYTVHVQNVNNIMEALKIEEQNLVVLATLKELQLATSNVLPFVYALLCSCQCISDLSNCVE